MDGDERVELVVIFHKKMVGVFINEKGVNYLAQRIGICIYFSFYTQIFFISTRPLGLNMKDIFTYNDASH